MRKITVLTIIIFLATTSGIAQKPDWFVKLRKLQKFPSAEKMVETFFNSPKVTYSTSIQEIKNSKVKTKVIEYELSDGKLEVYYSAGKCSEQNIEGYNLEDGVVLDYKFTVNKLITGSVLNLDLKNFKESKASDTAHIYFSNKKKGITYTFFDNQFQAISFSPPNTEDFRCEKRVIKMNTNQ